MNCAIARDAALQSWVRRLLVVRRRNILCSQNAAHIQKATPSFLYFVR